MPDCIRPPHEDTCRYSEQAVESAVKRVFAVMGIDVDDPKDVEEFRKDLRFGQSMRKASDKGLLVFIGSVAAAFAYALWAGVSAKLAAAVSGVIK